MKKNKILKLGLIGLGYWGPNFARTCFENEEVELVYCCDLNKQSLLKIGKRYPAVKLIDNYKEIIDDKEIDAVIIVTPPASHYKIVKDLINANKDVLVEKPITLNSKEAYELVQLAQRKKRILMVDHIFQFNAGIRKLKQIISKKELGKIFYVSGSYTALGPVRADVNSLWDLAPHYFYTLEYLLGSKPLWVSAMGGSYLKKDMEDVVYITLGFPDKVLAKIHVSWLYPYKVRNLVIVGSKKMAVFDDVATDQKVKIYDKGAFYDMKSIDYPAVLKVTYREGDLIIPRIEPKEPLTEVLKVFVEGIKKRSLRESDGKEGKDTVEMLEAAQKSLRNRGEIIKI